LAGKRGQIVIKVVLHPGADAKSGEDGADKEQGMQPIPPARRMEDYDPDFLAIRVIDLVFQRRRLVVRHELNGPDEALSRWTVVPFRA